MKNSTLLTGLLLILFTTSCKKAENRSCFKSVGKETEKVLEVGQFDKLFLREHIEYELIQDSTDKLVIRGGENLVNFVEWNISDDKVLEIKNKNKCNFLRNLKKKVKVEIHFTNIFNIHFEGSEPMTNRDTLSMPFFTLMIRDGAGSVNLTLKSITIDADISHGWGDYTFSGKTNFAKIGARSNGYCDVQNLIIKDSVYTNSESSGNILLNADGIPLRAELKSNGNIIYTGEPSSINVKQYGKGELLKK
jgi:hypothetical protein